MAERDEQAEQDPFDELGHPIHLFIDTSTFRRLQFPIGQSRFEPLMARIAEGDIRLVAPDVVIRELYKQASSAVDEARKAHAKFKRHTQHIRLAGDRVVSELMVDADWARIEAAVADAIEAFFRGSGIDVLTIASVDLAAVVDDYFDGKPPFGEGKKKSEFPDAIAANALLKYAEEQGCMIAVLSEDEDWLRLCDESDRLVWCSSLEQVVEHSQHAEAVLHEQIREMLEHHRSELESAVIDKFPDRGFYWESDEGHDSEIEEVVDEDVEEWPWSVVAIEDDWAHIEGEARISFRATAIYPDPNSIFRDPDTKELMSFGSEHAILRATVDVPISFKVNIEALRRDELEHDDLVIDAGDIWFTEDEIEQVMRDNENYDE